MVRMDEANDGVWEYFLLPPEKVPGVSLLVGERNPTNINAYGLESLDEVVAEGQVLAVIET